MRYRRLTFYASRCIDARDAARAANIARAGEQHAPILAGDDRGIYGDAPAHERKRIASPPAWRKLGGNAMPEPRSNRGNELRHSGKLL
jgi:hypothetical protein